MKILEDGHKYELKNFEQPELEGQTLKFINIESIKDSDALKTIYDGTTNEEVLSMMINRMIYLQEKFPCKENAMVITKLQESLMWLEYRTAERTKRGVEGKHLA